MALLYPDHVPAAFLHTHAQTILGGKEHPSYIRKAMKLLQSYSLIQIQWVILNKNIICTKRYERVISALSKEMENSIPSEYEPSDKTIQETMLLYAPHIQHVARLVKRQDLGLDSINLASVLSHTVVFFTSRAQFQEAEELADYAVEITKSVGNPQHKAKAASNQFFHHYMKGCHEDSEPHCRMAFTIRKRCLGTKHDLTRSSLHYLEGLYDEMNRCRDAARLYEEASRGGDYIAMQHLTEYRFVKVLGAGKWGYWLHQYSKRINAEVQPVKYEYGRMDLTLLHHAIQRNDIESIRKYKEIFRKFIAIGDKEGQMPLHYAAKDGYTSILCLLVEEYQADMNARTNNGWTVLHAAAMSGHMEIVKELVEKHHADANAKDNN
ncbi:uncharacterized protein VTP21DRAFT_1421 [Calcarisporiella thermophila]|uniref:uncharacterized protein n=1 Tax=Calcarisporiella thermophila TaxID=911321 RepID=UPI003742F59D